MAQHAQEWNSIPEDYGTPPNPGPGLSENMLTGISLKDTKINLKRNKQKVGEMEGAAVTFKLALLSPSPNMQEGSEWPVTYRIPLEPLDRFPEDGARNYYSRVIGQLKGAFKTILGSRATGDIAADIKLIQSEIQQADANDAAITVQVETTQDGDFFRHIFRKRMDGTTS
ncbi:MAG: hypothetical protein D6722_24675 [Bacteroidetes bacterium]|nr:MAG: hypothetical protein D6722_24675 [Bacteroidota bacterium]